MGNVRDRLSGYEMHPNILAYEPKVEEGVYQRSRSGCRFARLFGLFPEESKLKIAGTDESYFHCAGDSWKALFYTIQEFRSPGRGVGKERKSDQKEDGLRDNREQQPDNPESDESPAGPVDREALDS